MTRSNLTCTFSTHSTERMQTNAAKFTFFQRIVFFPLKLIYHMLDERNEREGSKSAPMKSKISNCLLTRCLGRGVLMSFRGYVSV